MGLRSDSKRLIFERDALEANILDTIAQQARLLAERDDLAAIPRPDKKAFSTLYSSKINEPLQVQRSLFEARNSTREKEREQLEELVVQALKQIDGLNAQKVIATAQLDMVREELNGLSGLKKNGLVLKTRVTSLEREALGYEREISRIKSEIPQIKSQIAATEIRIVQLETTKREEAISQLQAAKERETGLRKEHLNILEILSDKDIRAPIAGVVHESSVVALQSVVQGGAPLMYIVPQGKRVNISAQVQPTQIDQIFHGQESTLRFVSFSQKDTPELKGHVSHISADAIVDPSTGASFYEVEIDLISGEREKLVDKALLPGMPVEVLITSEERSPLSYILKPFEDYAQRALREE